MPKTEDAPTITVAGKSHKVTKGGRGARTKLTPDFVDVIAKKLNREADLPQLAASLRIVPNTLRNWLKRGETSAEEPYRSLYLAVMDARAKHIEELCNQGDTYAAMNSTAGVRWVQWKLSKFFKGYSDKADDDGETSDEDLASLSSGELRERARKLLDG